jgi:putative transposase
MDESGCNLNYPVRKMWMKRGAQKCLSVHGKSRAGTSLVGVLNWGNDQVYCEELARLNGQGLTEFFERLLLKVYPTQRLVLVMDNASYHHSQDVQAMLSIFEERLMILWLPPYSPDLNLIERFWKHLKQNVCTNRLYASLKQMLQAIFEEIRLQNCPDYPYRLDFSKNL